MLKRIRFILPLILFILIVSLLWRGLSLHPNQIPSPLLNNPAPSFKLPDLFDPNYFVTNKDFSGHVVLFNVWATWCFACAEEHELLLNLAKKEHILIYGLDYKDDPNNAKKWLKKYGNPYKKVAVDRTGDTAINWGVYGTPETFIIDKKGMIRYKLLGAISLEVWEKELKQSIKQLQSEP